MWQFHRELRATPRQANHVVAMLSKMFHLAERWKLRPLNSNPCRHIRRYPENARDRYPLPEELERIGIAMREMEDQGKLSLRGRRLPPVFGAGRLPAQ